MEVTAQQSEPLEEGAAAASVDPSLEHRDLQRQYHETTAAVKRAFTAYKKAAVATVGGKIAWDDEERSEAKASLSVVCDSLVKEKERCRQLLQKLEDKRDELEQQVDRLLGIGMVKAQQADFEPLSPVKLAAPEADRAGWRRAPIISIDTKGGANALEDLNRLSVELNLHEGTCKQPAFDGAALLLLTKQKLETWARIGGLPCPGGQDRLESIRAAAGPLRMAYAQQPEDSGSSGGSNSLDLSVGLGDQVPESLFPVERHAETADFWTDVLEMEGVKSSKDGSSLAEANIHTCGFSSGVGKTYAASRAANPDAEDLAFLEKKVASDGLVKELPRALACMRLLIKMQRLSKVAKGSQLSLVAVAKVLWEACQDAASELFNLQLSIPDNEFFASPEEVLHAFRKVLGGRVHFLLHLDDLQEASCLARPWYAGLLETFTEILAIAAPGQVGRGFVKELAAVRGLWEDLSEAIRLPGVCSIFTGRTLVPLLAGTSFANIPFKGFLGEALPLTLPPLSRQGILKICEHTLCASGRSIVEALGFILAHVRELERSGTLKAPGLGGAPWPVSEDAHPSRDTSDPLARATEDTEGPQPASTPIKSPLLESGESSEPSSPDHEEDCWHVSEEAKRLGCLVNEVKLLTCGIPLLVREVFKRLVERATQERWPERSLQYISDTIAKKGGPYAKGASAHHRSLMAFHMANLSSQEQKELLSDVSRRLRIPARFL